MDEVPILGRDDERQILKELCSQYDVPAYVRRARAVQDAFDQLVGRCRKQREEWQEMARTRIGLLRALAADFAALRPWLADEEQLTTLEHLHTVLRPRLRTVVQPTSSSRVLLRSLRELCESVERFNRRWLTYLSELDLAPINRQRDGYNRYYLLEKECATRSPRVARQGYRPLETVTPATLLEQMPLLPMPRLAG